ncbi:Late secretory pathway protein [Entamoeba marina]
MEETNSSDIEIEDNENNFKEDNQYSIDENDIDQILQEINVMENVSKTRVVLSHKQFNHIQVYSIENWCGNNKQKVVLYDCENQIFYELKRIHLEYASWYVDPIMLQDGSVVISNELDKIFIVLHFLGLYDICNHSIFQSQDEISSILKETGDFVELLNPIALSLFEKKNDQYIFNFLHVQNILNSKRGLVQKYLSQHKQPVRDIRSFYNKDSSLEVLFPYLGEYWFKKNNWSIPPQTTSIYADDYTKYERKRKTKRIEYTTPPFPSTFASNYNVQLLPDLCLPDINTTQQDYQYFILPKQVSHAPTLYGVCVYSTIYQTRNNATISTTKGLVIITRNPFLKFYSSRLKPTFELFLSQGNLTNIDFVETLQHTIQQTVKVPFTSEDHIRALRTTGSHFSEFVVDCKAHVCSLIKLLLLETKIAVLAPPDYVSHLSETLLGFFNIFPGLLLPFKKQTIDSNGDPKPTENFQCGFPLDIINDDRVMSLYSPLNQLNKLSQCKSGFIVGMANRNVLKHSNEFDVILDMQTGDLLCTTDSIRKAATPTDADTRFVNSVIEEICRYRVKHSGNGGEAWVITQFTKYLKSLLSCIAVVPGIFNTETIKEDIIDDVLAPLLDDYSTEFFKSWQSTHNFAHWKKSQSSLEMKINQIIKPIHPGNRESSDAVDNILQKVSLVLAPTFAPFRAQVESIVSQETPHNSGSNTKQEPSFFSSAAKGISSWFGSFVDTPIEEEETEEQAKERDKTEEQAKEQDKTEENDKKSAEK